MGIVNRGLSAAFMMMALPAYAEEEQTYRIPTLETAVENNCNGSDAGEYSDFFTGAGKTYLDDGNKFKALTFVSPATGQKEMLISPDVKDTFNACQLYYFVTKYNVEACAYWRENSHTNFHPLYSEPRTEITCEDLAFRIPYTMGI